MIYYSFFLLLLTVAEHPPPKQCTSKFLDASIEDLTSQLPQTAVETWGRFGSHLGMNPVLSAAVGGFGLPSSFWVSLLNALLLENPNHVHSTNRNGATALALAAQFGNVEAVKTLLAAGAAVDAADIQGATGLVGATFNGHVSTVEALLDAGASFPSHYDLAAVAKAEGHDVLADMLENNGNNNNWQSNDHASTKFTQTTCQLDEGLDLRLDAARCHISLAGCGNTAAMPSIDAYSLMGYDGERAK